MKWAFRRINPSIDGALSGAIEAIQEAGWSHAQILSSLADPLARFWVVHLPEIDLVAVRPSMRRRGIARGLLAALIAEEGQTGLAETRLELATANVCQRGFSTKGLVSWS